MVLYLSEQFGKTHITYILKPYTEECLIKKEFYNSITHYKISNKMIDISNNYNTLKHLYTIYQNIKPTIFTIYLYKIDYKNLYFYLLNYGLKY